MMADRQTKVTLSLIAQDYIRGIDEVASKTREAGSAAEQLAQKREAFNELGQAALALGTLAAAGVGLAVKKFADFDEAMSFVEAATHESAENMGLLREAALDAGADTVFSATESANAIEELGKAGLSTSDILNGGLDGALSLAAAGGLGVADAAGIAATALQQFNLKGSDTEHVADLLAAGAGKAMGDVSDLSQALNQAGLVADQTGLSIEETTAGLAAFASAGLLGSDAGTSFKSMLQRLTPQSAEAKAKMDELGISAYDAQGQFIGLSDFAGNLQSALGDLTVEQRNSALATIFGADAVRAATVLYNEGADGISAWEEKVNDSGYASETAAKRLDNLKGDVEQLGGALDTALIETGSVANDILRGLVQSATDAVDVYNNLPDPVKGATLAVGGLATAAGLASAAFFYGVPKVADFNAGLKTMGPRAQTAARGLKAIGRAAGPLSALFAVGMYVLDGYGKQNAATAEYVDELTASLDENTGAVTANTREVVRNKLSSSKVWQDLADKADISFSLITDAAMGSAEAAEKVKDAYEKALINDGYTEGSAALETAMSVVNDLLSKQPSYISDAKNAWEDNKRAQDDAAEATDTNAEALAGLEGKAYDANDAVTDLAESIRGFGSAQFDLRDANRAVEESLDDFSKTIKENGENIDDNTAKGRENNAALDDIALSYLDLIAGMADTGASSEELTTKMEAARKKFVESAMAAGYTETKANDLADELGLIPNNVDIAFNANTDPAIADINWYMKYYGTRTGTIIYRAQLPDTNGAASGNGKMGTYEDGGMIVHENAIGNIYDYDPGIYAGGPLYKFAEPNLPWEAFISGKAGQEPRNINIAYDALARLGALPQPQVIVQAPSVGADLSGMAITGRLEIGGDGLARIIDGRIVTANRDAGARIRRGSQRV